MLELRLSIPLLYIPEILPPTTHLSAHHGIAGIINRVVQSDGFTSNNFVSLGPPLFCFLIVFSREFVDVLELNSTEKLKNKKNTTDYIVCFFSCIFSTF